MINPTLLRKFIPLILFLVIIFSACGSMGSLNPLPATPTPTSTPTPTATPVPLAVSVNGAGITIPEFEAELARYQQAQTALGNPVSPETARKAVNDEFVNSLLLAQAATSAGYQVDDAALQKRIDDLVAQLGSPEALASWQTAHGYVDSTFRSDLRREMAAAHMRDQIAASVPLTADQVHVKQILLYNAEAAQQAMGYLKNGWNFNDLAAQYDPVSKGELGWFPQGYLADPQVEKAAFALQSGQYSDIIQTQAGYEILFLVARDPARSLSPDALLALQEHAVMDWLTQQRNKSTILITP
jgi:peptidyl-prolyl cis-trans isomerase C